MRIKKLSSRLFLFLTAWTLIAVILVALFISADYRRNSERKFSELLTANVYSLMGGVKRDAQGRLAGPLDLGDARYNQFDSGWYWSIEQVGEAGVKLGSSSLSSQRIDIPSDIPLNEEFQRRFTMVDGSGNRVSGVEAQVFLGDDDRLYSFKVTGNLDSVESEVSEFVWRLVGFLTLFGASLVFASYFLVRAGLRPLEDATRDLGKIREGEAEKLEGTYPDEVQPLIDETNALIASNSAIVERARTQVGNLAHSLKTPIAVVINEMESKQDKTSKLVLEQMDQMREQTRIYLDRARISARYGSATSRTDVNKSLEKILRVVRKLTPDLEFAVKAEIPQNLRFAGEDSDFQEIVGNLLENAAKYAEKQVVVSAEILSDKKFCLTIEDDGPGMTEGEAKEAVERGKRLDEHLPGTGLGLSIVKDITGEYSGSLELGRSQLGGLKAMIILPRVV